LRSALIARSRGTRGHLRPLREPLQELADGVRGLAADARIDLVEDHRLAAADCCDGERDARQLAAGRRLGDRRERKPRIRTDEEDDLVGARRARLARPQLDGELALAHADPPQVLGDGRGKGGRRRLSRFSQPVLESGKAFLGRGQRLGGRAHRVDACIDRGELRAGLFRACQKLLVGGAAEPALRVREAIEIGLDLLEAVRLGLQRLEKGAELQCRLT
jgi:hypothetical protein